MNENEKAATFIGWKPGMLTRHGLVMRMAEIDPRYAQTPMPVDPNEPDQMGTTYPAPDMSDPRNYMKAIETVEAQTHHGPIEMTVHCERDDQGKPIKFRWLVKFYKVLKDEYSVHDWLEPVEALAKLYDVSHYDDEVKA